MIDSPSYWDLLAEKIERDPSVLQIAIENIHRWRSNGHSAPHRLAEWLQWITAAQRDAEGLRQLLRVLRGKDPVSERLKDFSPFPGVLTREERRRARELCGYRH